jgi:hypothetical protein
VSGRSMLGRWRSPFPRRVMFALFASLIAAPLVVAGCASRSGSADTSRAPVAVRVAAVATPNPSTGPEIVVARAQALAAYQGYISAETSASQSADYGSPELSRYTSDPLLGQWIAQLFHLHVIGDVQRGAVVSHPNLVSLKLSKTSGTAIVRDCLDQSQIEIVNATTGKAVALPKAKPYLATATVYLYGNGAWMVSKVDTSEAKPC